DSEPPVEESPAEDTAEYSAESLAENSAEGTPSTGYAAAVRTEQAYVTMLYGLLDQARERSELELASVRARGGAGGTHQARLERDVSSAEHEKRIPQLNLTERGLCFGRVDDEQRLTLYIGRIGLRDDDYDLKLIDWRAPAARPFYAATPRSPQGLVRRRHIYTRLRQVTGVDDEVFDLDKLSDSDRATLSGEAALIAAVSSARTGRMADVVATIQAEQDRVIRADLPGVLVVQGGPGTGKTVAALHRAAYLLYTHRRTLERRGVLVIGPNATFLRYIGQVLPSLGETDVVLHTLGDLFPGVRATDTRDPAAVVKGDEQMVRVLQQAVRDRQRAPKADLEVDADRGKIRLRRRAELLRSPAAIRSAAGSVFSDVERTLLSRPSHPSRWTVADVPLLDELAELLGVDDSAAKAARRALERAQRLETQYAQDVLAPTRVADLGLVDAETLAAWNRDNGPVLSTAERAGADRSWAYGHLILDEAQELSSMAWRMVLRRNPTRSMTVVGDVAQTGSPAGGRSWEGMVNPPLGGRRGGGAA